ncbi:ATP-binding cassette domain-containing protein [Bacillus alkalicellulosilyticus]|uniref:ATP-binding cassette domain-containing protein n=1 Tax=Alkalihalobacterium alkalicellulosilyticum TaxID=1912214 RepID=UPI000997C9D3|nr:ATP-binding cassette domain-containing protein [Bacillus alkalicellulosilyticus]
MKIDVKGLSKKIKKQEILSNVTLSISGVYGLLGPNGAGKTTLMKILASIESFNSGRIYSDDKVITEKNYVKRLDYIGYLPQEFMIYPDLTIYEVLEHISVLQGENKKSSRRALIYEAVEQVNLTEHLYKKMKNLSGGMRRRVGIAQILLRKPSILLFDEPTAGLDIEERIRFRNLLKRLGKRHTVLICSHIVEDIELLCNKIGVIKNGKVLFEGSPDELKEKALQCIFEIAVSHEELDEVISTKEVVFMNEEKDKVLVRIFSKELVGTPVSPRLMDGYLALLKENSHE